MRFLHLTLLYFMLSAFSSDPATKILKSITAQPTAINDVEPAATNIIFQSKDGGQTWQDISQGLPENEQPEVFFAGESDLYLRLKNGMYRSKSNLKTLVWEKENGLDLRGASIAFNRSGVTAYNYEGQIYQKAPARWLGHYYMFKHNATHTRSDRKGAL
ncbi:hypothetical protein SAMN04488109_0420 [Chryseolinea serpens]|uniref:BNR/Asp-box repeat-containing protein n=1 Tax=Chryseolinea serpens TaxID=947013 RepID=A0A1M5K2W4_9BACT|nr:hypothetical protein [Chryseolinea serpens]SHG47117.1 hypothetical protein SAMN04488109_0420 [Chryseolinea serpens]